MGLGGGPTEWDDYEWVRLSDLPPASARTERAPRRREAARAEAADALPAGPAAGSLATAVSSWLRGGSVWAGGIGPRVLLVDLDNLRAGPLRWRRRMAMVVSLGRQADLVVLAGQEGAVRRARPHLAEFATLAQPVADGSDLADYVLLDAAARVRQRRAQFVVVSNDGIFAVLAARGALTVLSPGGNALSDRLRTAAVQVVDLAVLEAAAPPRVTARRTRGPAAPGPAGPHRGRSAAAPTRRGSASQARSAVSG